MSCAAKNDDKIDVMTLNRIVGGNHGAYAPYQVFFVYMLNKSKHISWCGGTILNKRYILTVKHCFLVDPMTPEIAIVGELNWCRAIGLDITDILFRGNTSCLAPIFEEKFENVKDVSEVIFHGNVSEAYYKDDLALLKVSNFFELITRE